jgi:hypothetical protein
MRSRQNVFCPRLESMPTRPLVADLAAILRRWHLCSAKGVVALPRGASQVVCGAHNSLADLRRPMHTRGGSVLISLDGSLT